MDNGVLFIIYFFTTALRLAAPLIFTSMGGLISEKSGVLNIGLEGMMAIGAFFGVLGSYLTNSGYIGILFAMIAGGCVALIHAVLSITFRANQTISGTAINIFGGGLASFLIYIVFDKGGHTDRVTGVPFSIPNLLPDIPILGELLSEMNFFIILAIVVVFLMNYMLNKTVIGLRIKAVGEHPQAVDTMGINVYRLRYICVVSSGILAGLGGAALSLGTTPIYVEGMVAGRGFIALAAMIFGKWKPYGALAGCLVFGLADALQIQAQGFGWNLSTEIYSIIPYVLAIITMIIFAQKSYGPKMTGKPYSR
jgi:general nucleoside transport system permease protein